MRFCVKCLLCNNQLGIQATHGSQKKCHDSTRVNHRGAVYTRNVCRECNKFILKLYTNKTIISFKTAMSPITFFINKTSVI